MSKPAVVFVAAAMAVTAGCAAVIAYFGLGLGFGQSFAIGLSALAGMAVIHLAFVRSQPREDPRVEELNHFAGDLADRLEIIERRLETIEGAMTERARAATKPLVDEIAALGGLVTTVAKEVAAHEVAIAKLKAAKEAAPPPPPPPPAAAPPPVEAPPPAAPAAPVRAARPAAPPAPWVPEKIQAPEAFDPGADMEPSPAVQPSLIVRIERALAEDRIEPYLQPIVTLPSRRTAHYEAFSRLAEADGVLPAAQFVEAAAENGRVPQLDRRMVERCASVALRVSARGGGLLFVNLARQTLADPACFGAISALLESQQELRRLLVAEIPQAVFEALSESEGRAVEALVAQGMRLSLDGVEDLRLDARALSRRGVRFVKLRAARLLDPQGAAGLAIHPADLANLLMRNGVELIATHVEEERTVPELLDMEVRLAQGQLFGVPRPVRPAAPDKTTPSSPGPRLVPRALP